MPSVSLVDDLDWLGRRTACCGAQLAISCRERVGLCLPRVLHVLQQVSQLEADARGEALRLLWRYHCLQHNARLLARRLGRTRGSWLGLSLASRLRLSLASRLGRTYGACEHKPFHCGDIANRMLGCMLLLLAQQHHGVPRTLCHLLKTRVALALPRRHGCGVRSAAVRSAALAAPRRAVVASRCGGEISEA